MTQAPAADAATTVWDRVASCESSNNWHIDTGNGFYGGLQFSASTWTSYNGGKYANRADLASRAEQIEVARRVLASQGPGAWPVCSQQADLTRADGGATTAPLPAQPTYANRTVRATSRRAVHHARRHHHHRVALRQAGGHVYRVHSGDTLARIAHRFHVDGGWRALWHHNRTTVHNPDLLRIGELLRIPA